MYVAMSFQAYTKRFVNVMDIHASGLMTSDIFSKRHVTLFMFLPLHLVGFTSTMARSGVLPQQSAVLILYGSSLIGVTRLSLIALTTRPSCLIGMR